MIRLYGVIVCPRCHRAKGVKLKQKTTACQCGHVIDLSGAKIYSKTDDARELSKAVAVQSAKLRGGLKEYERAASLPKRARGVHGRVADAAAKARGREEKIKAVAAGLTKELGEFTADDFAAVLASLGIAGPGSRLGELLEMNLVYEPGPGRYRAV